MVTKSTVQASPLLRLREPEVRALCRGAAVDRGDAWQIAGHVGDPTVNTDGLSAHVRGTWRQVERVTVHADARGLHTSCSCRAGEFCRHAAALLLHWVRSPRTFVARVPETYGDPLSLEDALDLESELFDDEVEDDQLESLLEMHTMTDLREMARLRGVRGGGRNKIELAATLAVSLANPSNIDAALATLTDDERAMLHALDLIDLDPNLGNAVGTAYRVLAGEADLTKFAFALHTLVKLGLVFNSGEWERRPNQYLIPAVVAARISLANSPLLRLVRAAERTDQRALPIGSSGLGLTEVLLVVTHEVVQGRIGRELPVAPHGSTPDTSLGWMSEQPLSANPKARFGRPQSSEVTLVPQPSLLSDTDLRSLAECTGGSVEMIDFAVELLHELGVITYAGQGKSTQMVAHEQLLYGLLQLPPGDRTILLTETWLSLFDAFDFRGMTLDGKRLELHTLNLPYHAPLALGAPLSSAVRALMVRLLARLATDEPEARWYDLPAWLDLLWTFTPQLLGTGPSGAGDWWFHGASEQDTRLDLQARASWQEIWEPLVQAMLLGPMTWLGLVDTSRQPDGTLSFRPRPEVATILQEDSDEVDSRPHPSLGLEIDPDSGAPEITVPAGYPDLILHYILTATTDLTDISPHGLRYRLTRQRAQEAFDSGGSGPDLLRLLAERSGGTVPETVRSALDSWWTSYGNVRLYDDLTLIELDDDILLQELLATSSLPAALIDVITPRLVAVDPAALPPLLEEMERLGYTPRVLEHA